MRWQRSTVRVVNQTRAAVLGQTVRIAATMVSRLVGLLGERELPAGDGLLIVPSQGVHTMGMMFPIDVVILDGDWKVIGLRPAMKPYRIGRVYWKAAAVLELPAGSVGVTGTEVGDQLEFIRIGADQS